MSGLAQGPSAGRGAAQGPSAGRRPAQKPSPGRRAAKRALRAAITWLVVVVLVYVIHSVISRYLAGRDIVAALLAERDSTVAMAALMAVLTRLFVFVLAPAWALHIAIITLLRFMRARSFNRARSPRAGSPPAR